MTDIKRLLARYKQGQCTEQELAQLRRYLNNEGLSEEFGKVLVASMLESGQAESCNDEKFEHLYQLIAARTAARSGNPKYRRLWTSITAAASVLIVALVGVWYMLDTGAPSNGQEIGATEILPGGNRATLTLADGKTITLSEYQTGIMVGDELSYLDGSSVLGEQGNKATKEQVEDPSQLQLTTPKGGTYQLTLPDGTDVWLNAASTLKYPSRFVGYERVVEITGEAYFSVAKDKDRPFKVISKGQEIEVLGTAFNVSAYADEAETKTTLVEGSIKLNSATLLTPGQQAVVQEGRAVNVHNVEVEQYIAWKNGYFYFDGILPQQAFTQLARWYDLELVYQGKMPAVRFFGMIERREHLGAALDVLKESGLNFKVVSVGGKTQLIVLSE